MMQIVIVNDGRTVYSGAFGRRQRDPDLPMERQSITWTASIMILANRDNGELAFRELNEALFGNTEAPSEWEGYNRGRPQYGLRPPPPTVLRLCRRLRRLPWIRLTRLGARRSALRSGHRLGPGEVRDFALLFHPRKITTVLTSRSRPTNEAIVNT